MSEENNDLKRRVENITTTSFSISGVKITDFKRFIRFCEDNATVTKVYHDKQGNVNTKSELCYSIGLKHLLDIAESDAKNVMLFDRMVKLEEQLRELEGKVFKEQKQPEAKKEFKGMGGR